MNMSQPMESFFVSDLKLNDFDLSLKESALYGKSPLLQHKMRYRYLQTGTANPITSSFRSGSTFVLMTILRVLRDGLFLQEIRAH